MGSAGERRGGEREIRGVLEIRLRGWMKCSVMASVAAITNEK